MVKFKHSGNFKNTEMLLSRASNVNIMSILQKYGQEGVNALSLTTPVDTGETAASWAYEIIKGKTSYEISWTNSNMDNGVPVVILIQYGHGTRDGRYVSGIDFINPALKPIFKKIADEVWREVTNR